MILLPKIFYEEAEYRFLKINCLSAIFVLPMISQLSAIEDGKLFTFSGHIHPGIKMNGSGNQSLMLPCFYFGKKHAILPAFSAFTGLAKIKPLKTDNVFALLRML